MSQPYETHLAVAAGHLGAADAALDLADAALASALALDPTATARLQWLLWSAQRRRGRAGPYFSESFQDRFLAEQIFPGRHDGVFVDIGAYDGVTGSNTLFFEKCRGWTGLCIEPDEDRFAELRANRSVPCVRGGVAGHDGTADFFRITAGFTQMGGLVATYAAETAAAVAARSAVDVVQIRTSRLDSLLERHGMFEVDYLSLDIEGAELTALQTLDFERFRIAALSVERNAGAAAVHMLLREAGYCRVRRLGADDIFVRADHVSRVAPHLPWQMAGEAMDMQAAGNPAGAEALYRDIVAAAPGQAGFRYNLAVALLHQSRPAEARAALLQALALAPDFAQARALLAHCADNAPATAPA
jgi:FkbM family methyltransferase